MTSAASSVSASARRVSSPSRSASSSCDPLLGAEELAGDVLGRLGARLHVGQLGEIRQCRLQVAGGNAQAELRAQAGAPLLAALHRGGDHDPAVAVGHLVDAVGDLAHVLGLRGEGEVGRADDLALVGRRLLGGAGAAVVGELISQRRAARPSRCPAASGASLGHGALSRPPRRPRCPPPVGALNRSIVTRRALILVAAGVQAAAGDGDAHHDRQGRHRADRRDHAARHDAREARAPLCGVAPRTCLPALRLREPARRPAVELGGEGRGRLGALGAELPGELGELLAVGGHGAARQGRVDHGQLGLGLGVDGLVGTEPLRQLHRTPSSASRLHGGAWCRRCSRWSRSRPRSRRWRGRRRT